MALNQKQQVEMVEKMRSERGFGRPEVAAQIRKALDRDEYFLGDSPPEVGIPEQPSRNAKREVWVEFAKVVSVIDHESLEEANRTDIIGMLEANGLVERKKQESDDEGDDESGDDA